jgi:serine/threonine protein kinase
VQFGRYRLIDRLGQGGMADVYRAVVDGPRGFTRQLVIKRIHKLFAREKEFIAMLGTEARVTALLNHPSIVQVFEFGQVGDELYLAMELAEGPDLARVLLQARERGSHMPPGVACWVIGQLADALAYAHSLAGPDGEPLGIIHRDVSPSNIVLSLVGGVKLLDFGIAKAAQRLHDDRTRTGAIKGKVSYLSPEQIDGLPMDHRADQYALGIVFHECLTGARLWKGLMRDQAVTPPSHLLFDVDPEIDAVVLRMLARAPEDRFADCADVAEVLAPLARRLNGDALALRNWLAQVGPFPSLAQPLIGD